MAQLFNIPEVFDRDYVYFQDASGAHKELMKEVDLVWELGQVGSGMDILDVGCGYGRLAGPLAARGVNVTGVDLSTSMIAEAKARHSGGSAQFLEGDVRFVRFGSKFDRIMMWFTSFGYFSHEENIEIARRARELLRDGGLFLIEQIRWEYLVANLQKYSVLRVKDDFRIDENTLCLTDGTVSTRRSIIRHGRVKDIGYVVRLYTIPELGCLLSAAGFSSVGVALGAVGDKGGERSPRIVLVAKR